MLLKTIADMPFFGGGGKSGYSHRKAGDLTKKQEI